LRSFLASFRVALTARLFSFRSGVRFAIWKEYQHFRVPADCARLSRVVCQPNPPSARRLRRCKSDYGDERESKSPCKVRGRDPIGCITTEQLLDRELNVSIRIVPSQLRLRFVLRPRIWIFKEPCCANSRLRLREGCTTGTCPIFVQHASCLRA
jgi:hypothetical protein